MTSLSLRVTPLHPSLGAEVAGVDLAAPIDGIAKATLGARVEGRNVATARLELATGTA